MAPRGRRARPAGPGAAGHPVGGRPGGTRGPRAAGRVPGAGAHRRPGLVRRGVPRPAEAAPGTARGCGLGQVERGPPAAARPTGSAPGRRTGAGAALVGFLGSPPAAARRLVGTAAGRGLPGARGCGGRRTAADGTADRAGAGRPRRDVAASARHGADPAQRVPGRRHPADPDLPGRRVRPAGERGRGAAARGRGGTGRAGDTAGRAGVSANGGGAAAACRLGGRVRHARRGVAEPAAVGGGQPADAGPAADLRGRERRSGRTAAVRRGKGVGGLPTGCAGADGVRGPAGRSALAGRAGGAVAAVAGTRYDGPSECRAGLVAAAPAGHRPAAGARRGGDRRAGDRGGDGAGRGAELAAGRVGELGGDRAVREHPRWGARAVRLAPGGALGGGAPAAGDVPDPARLTVVPCAAAGADRLARAGTGALARLVVGVAALVPAVEPEPPRHRTEPVPSGVPCGRGRPDGEQVGRAAGTRTTARKRIGRPGTGVGAGALAHRAACPGGRPAVGGLHRPGLPARAGRHGRVAHRGADRHFRRRLRRGVPPGPLPLVRLPARPPPTRLHRTPPLRLSAFLADAHRLGILRQVGPVYQFRHARLRERLAEADRVSP